MTATQRIGESKETFEVDFLELLRQSSDAVFLNDNRPCGVSPEIFANAVERYRTFYPSHLFVSENQVKKICRDNGLYIGPAFLYGAGIPRRNRLEINRFQVRGQDKVFDCSGAFRGWLSKHFPQVNPNARFEIWAKSEVRDFSGEIPSMLSIGDGINLIRFANDANKFRFILKVSVFGSFWLLDMLPLEILREINFDFSPVYHGAQKTHERAFVKIRVSDRHFLDMTKIDVSASVCPMVIAPESHFSIAGQKDRTPYQILPASAESVNVSATMLPADDPIVLQPVPYGYLVVSKWGGESEIGQIQNPITN